MPTKLSAVADVVDTHRIRKDGEESLIRRYRGIRIPIHLRRRYPTVLTIPSKLV